MVRFFCPFFLPKDKKLSNLRNGAYKQGVTEEKADYFRILAKLSVAIVVLWALVGTLSTDDEDVNENVRKQ